MNMQATRLETLFLDFRERGNPDALAEVFERVAPELLRTATSLCGSPIVGEDLLQATFVSAIERRTSWDESRALVPWLVGILTRHAREWQRRARRPVDPGRIGHASNKEPEATAEAEEARNAIEGSLNELPEPLRQVLVLHLRHDLAPAEIADALGRSPSTVRSQLQRGLARLRDRLPGGIAPVSAFAFAAPRGLDDVQAAVLATAKRLAPPKSTGTATGSGALAKATLLKTTICAVVATGALTVLARSTNEGADTAQPPHSHEDLSALAPEPSTGVRIEVPAPPPAEARVEAAPADVGRTVLTTAPLATLREDQTLRITVLDPRRGAVSGARITLEGVRLREKPESLYGWRAGEVESSTTDERGRAELVLPALWNDMHPDAIHFAVHHRDFSPYYSELVELATGHVDVSLEWGAFLVLSGWIGTEEGERSYVLDLEPELGPRSRVEQGDWFVRTDGRLSTGGLAPGEHQIAVAHTDAEGRRFRSAITTVEVERGGEVDVHLELLPASSVRGYLSPNVPRPVVSGEVLAHQSGGTERMLTRTLRTKVAPDGTFLLEEVGPGPIELAVLASGWASESPERGVHPTVEVRGNDVEIDVPMVPTGTLDFTVTGPDGTPVPRVLVSVSTPVYFRDGRWQYFDAQSGGETDETGRLVALNVPPGFPRIFALHPTLRIEGKHPRTSETHLAGDPLGAGEIRDVKLELVARETR